MANAPGALAFVKGEHRCGGDTVAFHAPPAGYLRKVIFSAMVSPASSTLQKYVPEGILLPASSVPSQERRYCRAGSSARTTLLTIRPQTSYTSTETMPGVTVSNSIVAVVAQGPNGFG